MHWWGDYFNGAIKVICSVQKHFKFLMKNSLRLIKKLSIDRRFKTSRTTDFSQKTSVPYSKKRQYSKKKNIVQYFQSIIQDRK